MSDFEQQSPVTSDLEYYNDLPGKVPPDVGPPPVPPLPQYHAPSVPQAATPSIPPPPPPPAPSELPTTRGGCICRDSLSPDRVLISVDVTGSTSSNLIDLHSELSPVSKRSWEHDYVNHDVAPHAEKLENGNDVFDMRKCHFIFDVHQKITDII